jgi:DhnA family fructose-bisphosphate aldolase class Ia
MANPAILIWTATYTSMPPQPVITTGSARFDDEKAANQAARQLQKRSGSGIVYDCNVFLAGTPASTSTTSATSAAST